MQLEFRSKLRPLTNPYMNDLLLNHFTVQNCKENLSAGELKCEC